MRKKKASLHLVGSYVMLGVKIRRRLLLDLSLVQILVVVVIRKVGSRHIGTHNSVVFSSFCHYTILFGIRKRKGLSSIVLRR